MNNISHPNFLGVWLRKLDRWVEKRIEIVLITPAFITLLALAVFPTLFLLYMSFSRWDAGSRGIVFHGVGNFARLFTRDTSFWRALWVSVKFTIIAVTVEYTIGLIMAIALNRKLPGLGIMRTIFILPMAMTPVVVGFAWRVMLDPNFGILNYMMQAVGLTPIEWLGKSSTALYALIAVDVWQWTPFMFLMLTAGLVSLPNEVLESALVDGASAWQQFWHVVFPMIRNISILALLIRTLDVWKVFDTIYVMTRGGPGTSTTTLNIYGYYTAFQWFNLGYAAAIVVVLILVSTIVAQVVIRTQTQLLEVE